MNDDTPPPDFSHDEIDALRRLAHRQPQIEHAVVRDETLAMALKVLIGTATLIAATIGSIAGLLSIFPGLRNAIHMAPQKVSMIPATVRLAMATIGMGSLLFLASSTAGESEDRSPALVDIPPSAWIRELPPPASKPPRSTVPRYRATQDSYAAPIYWRE